MLVKPSPTESQTLPINDLKIKTHHVASGVAESLLQTGIAGHQPCLSVSRTSHKPQDKTLIKLSESTVDVLDVLEAVPFPAEKPEIGVQNSTFSIKKSNKTRVVL